MEKKVMMARSTATPAVRGNVISKLVNLVILREAHPWNAYNIERAILRWDFLSPSDGNSISYYGNKM